MPSVIKNLLSMALDIIETPIAIYRRVVMTRVQMKRITCLREYYSEAQSRTLAHRQLSISEQAYYRNGDCIQDCFEIRLFQPIRS